MLLKQLILFVGLFFSYNLAFGENLAFLDLESKTFEKIDLTTKSWWISPGVFLSNDQLQQDFSQAATKPKSFLGPMPTASFFMPSIPADADAKNLLERSSFFGTMFIRLSNIPAGEYSLLFIGSFAGSHIVSLVEGSKETFLFKAGNLSPDIKSQSLVTTADHYENFVAEGKDVFLKVHYSVPEQKRIFGEFYSIGFGGKILLFPKEKGASKILIKRVEIYSVLGFYIFFTIYSLSIFLLRREDKVSFWIFISSLLLSLRYINTERIFSSISDPNTFALFNSSSLGIIQAMAQHSLFILIDKTLGGTKRQFIKVLYYLPIAYSVGIFELMFMSPYWLEKIYKSSIGHYFLASFIVSLVWGFALYLYYGVYFLKKKNRIAEEYFAFFACLCIITGGIADFFIASKYFDVDFYLSSWSMALGILFFSLSTGAKFSSTFAKSKELNIELDKKNKEVETVNQEVIYINRNLEKIVEIKTQDVRSMLDNIPQGILLISSGLIISKEYSAHLEIILNRTSLSGESIKNILFINSDLSLDMQDRAEQTLIAALDEDALAFELNESNLPRELIYSYNNVKKSLRITWNVEANAENIVTKILVTLLDVSAEKSLEKEVEKQKHEMQIIKQLVDCGAEKFSQFVANSDPLMREIVRLIQANSTDISYVKILFLNMHTIKGEARSLGFRQMADILHEVEQYYSELIRNRIDLKRDRIELDIIKARAIFDEYIEINRTKLGRKDTLDKVSVDINFLEGHYRFLGLIDRLGNGVTQDELHRFTRLEKEQLADLIFKSISVILDDCLSQCKKIAHDLDKLNPSIDINIEDFAVNRKSEQMLRNCMTHLIRNAMDHGIEKKDERLRSGKDAQGTISIRGKMANELYLLEFYDDGRGLAIDTLREKGQLNKLLLPNANLQDVANMIFSSGFSTAKRVNQISGRGVGMEAVKRFIEDDGGSIQVIVGDQLDPDGKFYRFKLVLGFKVAENGVEKLRTA